MYRKGRRILAGVLAFVLVFSSGGLPALAENDTGAGYIGGLCEHHAQHTDECGYAEATEGSPCAYECEICAAQDDQADTADSGGETSEADAKSVELISWEWVDEEGYLTESDGAWGIGVPGASEENPLTKGELEPMLPKQITGENADGENVTADVSWDLSAIPEEGVWEGELELTAELSGAYKLREETSPLVIKVDLGGAATYASQANLEANTVEGISPQGTTINMFDY